MLLKQLTIGVKQISRWMVNCGIQVSHFWRVRLHITMDKGKARTNHMVLDEG